MCGRFIIDRNYEVSQERFSSQEIADAFLRLETHGYNLAPGQQLPIVLDTRDGRRLRMMHWGLRRPFARNGMPTPTNARAETILDKPMFRDLVARKRCLIPGNGYYEWKPVGGKRIPYYISTDQPLYACAGIYERFVTHDGVLVESYCMITVPANEAIADIHPRMPAILLPEDEAAWSSLDVTDERDALELVRPYPSELMRAHAVTDRVNDLRNQGKENIEPRTQVQLALAL